MDEQALNIAELTAEERLDLLARLGDSLTKDPTAVPVTDPQRQELDRRMDTGVPGRRRQAARSPWCCCGHWP